mgnify:CR=1 FL=1
MWVAPTHRQLGIGAQLVNAIVDWVRAEGARTLRLIVMSNNDGAIEFYQKPRVYDNARKSAPIATILLSTILKWSVRFPDVGVIVTIDVCGPARYSLQFERTLRTHSAMTVPDNDQSFPVPTLPQPRWINIEPKDGVTSASFFPLLDRASRGKQFTVLPLRIDLERFVPHAQPKARAR